MARFVAVNEKGLRIGQDHPKAVLTDAEVRRLLDLRDEGYGYKRLAQMFEIPKRTVRSYCAGRTRNQLPARWSEVKT